MVRTDRVAEPLSSIKHTLLVLTLILDLSQTVSVYAQSLQFVIKEHRAFEKGSDTFFHSASQSSLALLLLLGGGRAAHPWLMVVTGLGRASVLLTLLHTSASAELTG